MTIKGIQQLSAEKIDAEKVVVRGERRIPLRVLAPPECRHLIREGRAQREMICKYASRLSGFEIHTHGLVCRYDCPAAGGPQAEDDRRDDGSFLAYMLERHYNGWNPVNGVDKYVRKLASNPTFAYPKEADIILPSLSKVFGDPITVTVTAVGSLAIGSVMRPLKDFDLMLVVRDYDEYWARRQEIQDKLPRDIGGFKVDWFVGESLSGCLGGVDLISGELHLSYDFPHAVDETIKGVVNHSLIGKWPERFQKLINEATGREHSHPKLKGAARGWQEGKKTWRKAESFTRSMLSGRRASDEEFRKRHISCHGTEPDGTVVGKPCVLRRKSTKFKGFYCGACGCGDKKLANLGGDPETGKSKLQFKHLTCPLEKEGFSNESNPA